MPFEQSIYSFLNLEIAFIFLIGIVELKCAQFSSSLLFIVNVGCVLNWRDFLQD